MKNNIFFYMFFPISLVSSINLLFSNNHNNKNYNSKVKDIYIIGKTKYDKNTISKISEIYPGDIIDIYGLKIDNAIKKLWKSKLFKSISVYKEQKSNNTVDIFFELEDLIKIHKIIINNDQYKKDEDEEYIDDQNFQDGRPITESFIQDLQNEIKDFFKLKGYNEVAVNSEIKKEKDQNILYFFVNKGKKIELEEIYFEGNKVINNKELYHILNMDRSFFISSIIGKPTRPFIQSCIENDLKKIREKYYSIGYRFARIMIDSIWKKKSGDYGIKIKIIEGVKYYIDQVDFVGNFHLKDEYLRSLLSYKRGNVYNRIKIENNIFDLFSKSILNRYLRLGYLFVTLLPLEEYNGNKICLKIYIQENLPVYVNEVKIFGNNITNDEIIRREIDIFPGDIFSMEKIIRSYLKIEDLLIFDHVSFRFVPDDDKNNYINLEWYVKEKNTNEFRIQGSFDKNFQNSYGNLKFVFNNLAISNIMDWAEWDWNKWNPIPKGKGDQLILSSKIGKSLNSIGFSIIKHGLNPNDSTLFKLESDYSNHKLINNEDKNKNYKYSKLTTSIGLDKKLSYLNPYSKISISLNGEKPFHPKRNNLILDDNHIEKFNNFYLNTDFYIDSSYPNNIFPTQGNETKFSFSTSPPYSILENDKKNESNSKWNSWIEFFKIKIYGNWYKKIQDNLVLKLGGEIGSTGTFKKNKKPFYFFHMGGNSIKSDEDHISLRGYSSSSLSKWNLGYNQDLSTKYKKMLMEIRYLTYDTDNLKNWVHCFLEGGSTHNKISQLLNPFNINKSIGFGTRFFWSPIGVVGLDVAYPLDSFEKSDKWKIHFAMGS